MEKLTKQEIEKICETHKQALLAKLEVDNKLEKTKVEQIKVQKHYLLAREDLQAIRIN